MNSVAAKNHFMYLAGQSGLEQAGLSEHVDRAIGFGLNAFWNAKPWSFRSTEYSMTITTVAESYDLPTNFAGIRTLRETASQTGGGLVYWPIEEFDRKIPRPTEHQAGYVQIFSMFYNNNDDTWKVKFFPVPSSGTVIKMLILTKNPDSIEKVPEKFNHALAASIERFLYKPGSQARSDAINEYALELQKAEVSDRVHMARLVQRQDDTDQRIIIDRPWL
jgi:hypothetical protein